MPSSQLYWMPATFRERGVAAPFTSPMLAGARVRLLERRCDLVVPHPGGARGVYIFTLASLSEFCAPTLHDLVMAERLQGLYVISPASVRAAARAVAREGAAGRAAAEAAARAEVVDAGNRAAVQAVLLAATLGGNEADSGHRPTGDPAQRARSAVLRLATRAGRTPEAVLADIEKLAAQVVSAGLDLSAGATRGPVLLARLVEMTTEAEAWLAKQGGGQALEARVIEAAQAAAAAGRAVLDDARAALADPAALLAVWAAEPDRVINQLERPDWLLDGWEPICLLWRDAKDDAARADALVEAALSLPPFPPEGDGWFAKTPDLPGRLRGQAVPGCTRRPGGRMPGDVVGVIARNERMRAMTA